MRSQNARGPQSPRAAENFRVMATGEKGAPYTYKGATFYRIIDMFIDQTGASSDSIYGGSFKARSPSPF